MHPARVLAKKNNEYYYNTNEPCKYGHLSIRYTHNGTCKDCHKVIMKKQGPSYKLKRKYNLTVDQYNEMLLSQNGMCKICGLTEKTIDGKTGLIKTLSVDHCHDTNKVRGLLCNNCNQGLGKFYHNSKFLHKAALYCEAI